MTAAELLNIAQRHGRTVLSADALEEWLRESTTQGWIVEDCPGDFTVTAAGVERFGNFAMAGLG